MATAYFQLQAGSVTYDGNKTRLIVRFQESGGATPSAWHPMEFDGHDRDAIVEVLREMTRAYDAKKRTVVDMTVPNVPTSPVAVTVPDTY